MKFPSLIKRQFCKTSAEITIFSESLSEDGSPIVIYESKTCYPGKVQYPSKSLFNGAILCNYQDGAKTVMTEQKKIVRVNGTILIPTDIISNVFSISSGYVMVNGVKRDIIHGTKARNPDGSVNYTKLEVE